MVQEEMLQRLDAAIEQLPARLRDVAQMRWQDRLMFREIAKAKGHPIGTILG